MNEMTTNYKYDERNKKLIVTRKHELTSPADEKQVVGNRDVVDTFDEIGIRSMMEELNKQLNSYQRQSKILMQQVEKMKEVSVDEEFLAKFEAVQEMQNKKKQLENLDNADKAIKELQKQIRDVKEAIGDRIKW